MKTLTLSIIILSGIIIIGPSFSSKSFADESINLGGHVQILHYQFSNLAAAGDNVYVTYQENIGDGAGASVFFRKSSDAGSSFSTIIPLSNNHRAANPLVAASGNNVYVAWMENWGGSGNSYIMFEHSSDNGNTFS